MQMCVCGCCRHNGWIIKLMIQSECSVFVEGLKQTEYKKLSTFIYTHTHTHARTHTHTHTHTHETRNINKLSKCVKYTHTHTYKHTHLKTFTQTLAAMDTVTYLVLARFSFPTATQNSCPSCSRKPQTSKPAESFLPPTHTDTHKIHFVTPAPVTLKLKLSSIALWLI